MIKRLLKFGLLMFSAYLDGLRYILFEEMDVLVVNFECSNVLSKEAKEQIESITTLEALFRKEDNQDN